MSAGRPRAAVARRLRRLSALGALTAALSPFPAQANGRYPSAQQVLEDPRDPDTLWARTTYGLLRSVDGGRTFRWICEDAVGWGPSEDPPLQVLSDGAVLVATSSGMQVTRNAGCDWAPDPNLGTRFMVDVAPAGGPAAVIVLSTEVRTDGSYDLRVHLSTDDARSYRTLEAPAGGDLIGTTLDAAPSDPERLYVSALVLGAGGALPRDAAALEPAVLAVSEDGGATWVRRPIPGTNLEDQPFIAAIDPTDPDSVYVRVRGPNRVKEPVVSRLLHSPDAGRTWAELFRGEADLLGFALGEGGRPILVGLGTTREQQRPVDEAALGIYRADGPGLPFTRGFAGHVGCLARSLRGGFHVCTATSDSGFELGYSTDAGETVEPRYRFGEGLDGPATCTVDSDVARACATQWQALCQRVGACASPADASTGGGGADAGPRPPREVRAACGCRAPGPRAPGGGAALALAVAGLAFARRRGTAGRLSSRG